MDLFDGYLIEMFKARDSKHIGVCYHWENKTGKRLVFIEIKADKKKDNSGRLKDISKVQFKMHDVVKDDLLEYLRKNER